MGTVLGAAAAAALGVGVGNWWWQRSIILRLQKDREPSNSSNEEEWVGIGMKPSLVARLTKVVLSTHLTLVAIALKILCAASVARYSFVNRKALNLPAVGAWVGASKRTFARALDSFAVCAVFQGG